VAVEADLERLLDDDAVRSRAPSRPGDEESLSPAPCHGRTVPPVRLEGALPAATDSRDACDTVVAVDDLEVIDAFLKDGVHRAFGPTLHVEGDTLMLNGWWHAALRIDDGVFVIRNEEPREESSVLPDLAAAMTRIGLSEVAVDHPLIQPITYTQISLGQMSWALWAADLATADASLTAKATADSFLSDSPFTGYVEPVSADFSAELGGARRVAGLPSALVLTVGLEASQSTALEAALADVRMEHRSFDEFAPSACGALIPGVVVVNAREATGREFIMELRTEACGRFLPVIALTEGGINPPPGADEALDPALPPSAWVAPVRAALP
jgi:hypothetical protein